MRVIDPVSTICLSEAQVLNGLSMQQAEADFAGSAAGILEAVRKLEEALGEQCAI